MNTGLQSEESTSPNARPPISGQAWAALVCGVGGLFCVPVLLPILAVILGHMARSAKTPDTRGGPVAVVALILGYLGIFVSILLLIGVGFVWAVGQRRQAVNTADMSNLRQMLVALQLYADDNQNQLPASLAELAAKGYAPAGPEYRHPLNKHDPPMNAADIQAGKCDYKYLGAGKTVSEIPNPSRAVILYTDIRSMHYSLHLAFLDGHVESSPAETIEEACRIGGYFMVSSLPADHSADNPESPASDSVQPNPKEQRH